MGGSVVGSRFLWAVLPPLLSFPSPLLSLSKCEFKWSCNSGRSGGAAAESGHTVIAVAVSTVANNAATATVDRMKCAECRNRDSRSRNQ